MNAAAVLKAVAAARPGFVEAVFSDAPFVTISVSVFVFGVLNVLHGVLCFLSQICLNIVNRVILGFGDRARSVIHSEFGSECSEPDPAVVDSVSGSNCLSPG